MNLTLVSPATISPLSIPEAKEWLRLDHTTEDAVVGSLVEAVRLTAERYGIAIGSQTWDWRMEWFPPVIRLPLNPVQSITSITYTDSDGTSQTLASSKYQFDMYSCPARIEPAYGTSWPATRRIQNAVKVRFVAGYDLSGATPEPLPEDLLQAMRLALWDAYYCRGDHDRVMGAVDAVFSRYTVYV